MNPDDPRHGTYAGVGTHRRAQEDLCGPCREASRRYRRGHSKATRMGRSRKIPTPIVARHVARLYASGMTRATVADLAGVCPTTLTKMMRDNPRPTTLNRIAAAILAVQPGDAQDKVAAWRVVRRLQALNALGWSTTEIGRRVGWQPANVRTLMHPEWRNRPTVTLETFRKFDGLYRQLSMQLPPSGAAATVARSRAQARGWAPPLAWDDIDNPDETPSGAYRPRNPAAKTGAEPYDGAAVLRILNGDWRLPCTPADKREVVARWTLRDPTQNARGVHENEWDRPSYAYLERLTGWKVDRYLPRGAA